MNFTKNPHFALLGRAGSCAWLCALVLAVIGHSAHGTSLVPVTNPTNYRDGRPYAGYRMDAVDQGKILPYGLGPNQCDSMNAREALINYVEGKYYLYYDGAGPNGWVACLAESTDLTTWVRKGPILDFGPGSADSAAACSPWIIKDDSNVWHMYYLGTPNTTGGTDKIPIAPYLALHATSASPAGPWTKQYSPAPFTTKAGTYYSMSAYPGHVIKQGSEYMMFFGSADANVKRTISIARTTDLNGVWTVDPTPALPVTEQLENSSIYYEPTNQTWFLFTNHIGDNCPDGVWVYWTKNINVWNPACKAVVLDGSNCNWSYKCIGMPSVVQVGNQLKLFYDGPGGNSTNEMYRSVGMATLQLPLDVSLVSGSTLPVRNPSFEMPGTSIGGPWAMFGSPWNVIDLPSNYQQVQAVSAGYFTSTVAGGGAWAALLSTDDVPLARPLIQNLPRSVTAGDTLAVTFWLGRAKNTTGGQGVAYFDVSGTKYTMAFDTTILPADSWQSYTLTQTVANSGNLSLGFYATTQANSFLDKISDVTVTAPVVDPNAPTSSGASLTTLENTPVALSPGNFGYADPQASPLTAVQITTLAALGTLKLNGTPVTINQIVAAADIGNLTYQPGLYGNGVPYSAIGIKVKNANNLWSNYASMTVNVTHVNHAPTSTGGSLLMKKSSVKTFAAADFPFLDVDAGDTLGAIMVTSLPAQGTLMLGGTPITSVPIAEIAVANLGSLTYTPASSYTGADSFTYQVRDALLFSADATLAITVSPDIFVLNGSFETPNPPTISPGGPWGNLDSGWTNNLAYYARRYDLGTPSGGGIWSLNLSDPGAWIAQDMGTSVNAGSTLSLTFSTLRENIYKSPNGGQGKLDVSLLVGAATYTQRFDLSGDIEDTWITKTFSQQIATAGNLTIKFAHVDIAGVGDRITTWNTNNGPGDIGRVQIDAVSNISVTSTGSGGTPTLTGGTLSGALSTTYGTASSPVTFTVAGANMTSGILVTAPTGFEVSLASGSGYGSTITVGSAGTIGSTTVYIRLAASAPVAGSYNSQNIMLSSSGAASVNVTTAASGNSVSKAALTLTSNNQNKLYGTTQTTPVTGSTAFTASGLQNNETVGTVTLSYASGGLLATDAVGSTSTITPSAAAAGTFAAANYTIGYSPGTLTVVTSAAVITLADTLGAVNTTYGMASATPTSFRVSGSGLTSNLTVTPPAGYEVSLSSGSGYTTSLSIPASGTLASTQVYVRLAATTVVNGGVGYTGNITVSGGGASSKTIATASSTVAKATPTVVVTPYSVAYDGNPQTATVTSITGVNGETGATVGTVTLNTTHTNVGIYNTDSWIFTGTGNYNNIGSTTSTITVANGSFETTGAALGGPWFRFGSPWSITNSPSNYQVVNAVTGNFFSSTVAGGGTYIGLINNDDCPITAPLVQNLGTSVSTGDTLSVTFYIGRALSGAGGAGVAYFDVAGTKYTMAFDTSAMTAGTWQLQTMTKTITNSGNLSLGFYGISAHTINAWLDSISNVSRTSDTPQIITNTINKATPTATLTVSNTPVTYDGTAKAATVSITSSSVPGTAQNILTGSAASQTAAGSYAVTANFVPNDTTNYNTLAALAAGNFVIAGSYDSWAAANGVTGGVSGDSNHDGLQNGIAYFMGVSGRATNPGLGASNTVTWPMSATFSGTFVVQTSPDLGTWTNVSPQPTRNENGNLVYTLLPGQGRQFVRLVVTPN